MAIRGEARARAGRENLRKTPSAGREVEIKLRVADRAAMLRRLRQLRASGGVRAHEMNTLYDTPMGSLAREGKLVRIRVERPAPSRGAGKAPGKARWKATRPSPAAVLTYKGPAQPGAVETGFHGRRYKIREEHELRVDDAEALVRVFEGMGLRPLFRYEKYRTTYRLPGVGGVLVELDETPIGDFLELEGEAAAIDRAAGLLGFRPTDYITKSYGALFVERRRAGARAAGASQPMAEGTDSADMLFARPH
jgi:adenylate cyclase, class 2